MYDMAQKLISAIWRGDRTTFEQLLRDADANAVDEDGVSLLMNVILHETADVELVKLLIRHGADVNFAEAKQHWSALHFAARDQHLEIVKLLLEAGADPNAVEVFGNTPLGRSLSTNQPNLEIVKLLVSYGADPYRKNNYGNSPVDTAKLMGNQELLSVLTL